MPFYFKTSIVRKTCEACLFTCMRQMGIEHRCPTCGTVLTIVTSKRQQQNIEKLNVARLEARVLIPKDAIEADTDSYVRFINGKPIRFNYSGEKIRS